MQHRLKLAATGLMMALLVASGPGSSKPATPGADWLRHGAIDQGGNFSPLGQIAPATIGKLGLAWSIDLPQEHVLEGTPLAVNGILYFTGSYSTVYAVDARTGKQLWRYDPEVWKHNQTKLRWTLAANRGVAYEAGRIFVGTVDGRLVALDAKSGKPLWSVETVDRDSKHTITAGAREALGLRGKVKPVEKTDAHM